MKEIKMCHFFFRFVHRWSTFHDTSMRVGKCQGALSNVFLRREMLREVPISGAPEMCVIGQQFSNLEAKNPFSRAFLPTEKNGLPQ